MTSCERCGSYAINDHLHGRIRDADTHLCDVCYWRERAERLKLLVEEIERNASLDDYLKSAIQYNLSDQ